MDTAPHSRRSSGFRRRLEQLQSHAARTASGAGQQGILYGGRSCDLYAKPPKGNESRPARRGADADLGRAYNEAWYDRGNEIGRNRRTSRVIDPFDGRIPPMTPAGQKKFDETHAWIAEHSTDAAENQPLFVRCLTFAQSGPPMLPGNYNDNYWIVQALGYFSILSEQPHQTRIIPLGEHAALPQNIKQWMGDSQGRWEGDTLVIETANMRFNEQSRFGN